MKRKKGEQGYISHKKKKQALTVAVFIAAGLSLFFICRTVFETSRNFGTVVAVLLTLPAAKALVNLILFLPYRSVSFEDVSKITALKDDSDALYFDLVFTSEQSAMHLDALCVRGTELIAWSEDGAKEEKIVSYFTESLRKRGIAVHMHVFRLNGFLSRLGEYHTEAAVPEEITEFIRMILVG